MTPFGRPSGCTWIALTTAAIACIAAQACASAVEPAPSSWPRADAVASVLHAATRVEEFIAEPGAQVVARAIGGPYGEEWLAQAAANLFGAAGASAAADIEWNRAAELARRHGDLADYGRALARRADIALAQGDYERCQAIAEALDALGRETGDAQWTAIALRNLGVVARRRGHLDAAIAYQQRALEGYRDNADAIGSAQALTDLSTAYRDRGDLAKALDAALETLSIREKTGDQVEVAYRNIALLYRDIEDTKQADVYFRKALDTAGSANPLRHVLILGPYASLLNDAGDHPTALAYAKEALAIDAALGDRAHQGFEHLEIGRALLAQRALGEATDELETALEFGRELGQQEIIARALLHLADVSLRKHDYTVARGRLDEAIAELESGQLRSQLTQAYALREQLARAEGDYPNALRFAHKYASEREELLGLRAGRQLAAQETRHQREQTEQQIALLAKDNQLKTTQIEKQQLQRRLFAITLGALGVLLLLVGWRFVSAIRHNRKLAASHNEIERQRAALDTANQLLERRAFDLRKAAITDSMTGIANRGHTFEQLASLFEECRRRGRSLSALLIDFDHFKQINDAHGHLFGDNVLIAGVAAMRECLRPGDLIGRVGGEEFIVAIAERSEAQVGATAERLRGHVAEALAERLPQLHEKATISIGISRVDAPGERDSVKSLLEAADEALYAAKREGRDRVRHFARA